MQALTGMSKADIMRLCMRIGLVDLRAAEHDIPGIVKRIADDAGVSFTRFAASQNKTNFPHSLNEDATPYVTEDAHLDRSISNLTAQVNDDIARISQKKTRKS